MGKLKKQTGKKRKFTFNIVDALIILILVAIIATIVYAFVLNRSFEDLYSKEVEITYTVSINGVEEDTVEYISRGDKVYHSGKDKNAGTVVSVEYSVSEGGKGIDMVVTVSATARVNNDGVYSINSETILKGNAIDVKFAKYHPEEVIFQDIIAK